ncbi:hypothetical protein HK097_000621 [Rhizophlyctis rosea]|uniref:Uncharacterized protein n=1 Tax=Rhizophlyctis rosea TaxID=64517 RepID=A0AAD5X1B7_9FUNG|nr:hypothetical protein HK097_000621 [Rhizophlyctis rosea]
MILTPFETALVISFAILLAILVTLIPTLLLLQRRATARAQAPYRVPDLQEEQRKPKWKFSWPAFSGGRGSRAGDAGLLGAAAAEERQAQFEEMAGRMKEIRERGGGSEEGRPSGEGADGRTSRLGRNLRGSFDSMHQAVAATLGRVRRPRESTDITEEGRGKGKEPVYARNNEGHRLDGAMTKSPDHINDVGGAATGRSSETLWQAGSALERGDSLDLETKRILEEEEEEQPGLAGC